jgi:hypothetical protein
MARPKYRDYDEPIKTDVSPNKSFSESQQAVQQKGTDIPPQATSPAPVDAAMYPQRNEKQQ